MSLLSKQSSNLQTKEKKTNPIIWIIFGVLVPMIVAAVIAVVIMSIAGVNVGEWVKQTSSNLPIISSLIKTDEDKSIEELEEKLAQMIEKKDREIAELEATIDEQVYQIDQLSEEVLVAEQQLLAHEHNEEVEHEQEKQPQNTIKEMAASYQKMNHNQAAKIIEEMDRTLALALLNELPNDVRGKIIEKMDGENAVIITEAYMNQGE